MNTGTIRRGRDAESLACRYLERRGLSLIERNYQSRPGEIDLIMDDAGSLVFVEVRYRRQTRFGSGAESVDRRKQAKIVGCAQVYLQTHPGMAARACRFDVVSISGDAGDPVVEWIQDAFSTLV
ncbi:MAG: YraN family protein [Gammaproteobacteria bacterium]|nr:YraN family protein [Gammaproteobacteria bacterium]